MKKQQITAQLCDHFDRHNDNRDFLGQLIIKSTNQISYMSWIEFRDLLNSNGLYDSNVTFTLLSQLRKQAFKEIK